MSHHDRSDEPLSPALQALVDEERQRSAAAPQDDARLWARIEASVDWIDARPAGDGAVSGLPAGPSAPPPARAPWRRRLMVAALVLGCGAFGAGARELYVRARARPAPPIEPAPIPRADPPPVVAIPRPEPGPLPAPPQALPAPAPLAPIPAPPADGTIAREQQLLEMARSALGLQRLAEAERALAQHRRDFPAGRLAEERDSLVIQLLVAQGRLDAARAAAARFHAAHPNAISWASLQRLLAEAAAAKERP